MFRRMLRSALLWALQPPPVIFAPQDFRVHQPYRKHKGDAGFDLYTIEDITIPIGGFVDVHTGVYVQMPEGIWGRITNRSSTFRTWHLQVLEGIIDQGYTGELFVGVINPPGNGEVFVPAGTRLAQLIFHTMVIPVSWDWMPIDEFRKRGIANERGSSGFGSTGK